MTPEEKYNQVGQEKYNIYMAGADKLETHAFELSAQHDQWIMTLSGGSLGLSITFIDKIAPHPGHTIWLLFVAWTAFGISLIAAFFGIYFGEKAVDFERDRIKRRYDNFIRTRTVVKPYGDTETTVQKIKNKHNKRSVCAGNIAKVTMLIGIVLFFIFCGINIETRTLAEETAQTQKEPDHAQENKPGPHHDQTVPRPDQNSDRNPGQPGNDRNPVPAAGAAAAPNPAGTAPDPAVTTGHKDDPTVGARPCPCGGCQCVKCPCTKKAAGTSQARMQETH
jgi:hypothetical protein